MEPCHPLLFFVDMAWQKRAAGHSYNSPSGVLHAIGGYSGKIIHSFIYHNKFNLCALQEDLARHLQSSDDIEDRDQIIEIKAKMKNNENHDCLKKFSGPSKSMETCAIVELIKMAPEQLGAYIRIICMDDDTITRSHIKEDLGLKTRGCLPKNLSGIKIVADPSHRKRTVSNWYCTLEKKPVAESALTGAQCKILATHFGHFQNQIKNDI